MAKYSIDIEDKKLYANLTLKWCKKNLGVNRRKKFPKVVVKIRANNSDGIPYGEYYFIENRIVIYDSKCKSIKDVVSTVIHEYTHYLQSMKKYFEYFNTHYYSTHPFEREAIKNSNFYTSKCMYKIKKLIS